MQYLTANIGQTISTRKKGYVGYLTGNYGQGISAVGARKNDYVRYLGRKYRTQDKIGQGIGLSAISSNFGGKIGARIRTQDKFGQEIGQEIGQEDK